MVALVVVIIIFAIPVVIGIAQYRKHPKPPAGMTYDELREYYYTRAWEKKESVTEYLETGQKVKAVKEFQRQTGCSLSDATKAVTQLEMSIKRRSSSRPAIETQTLITSIDGMDGHEFEYFCADILKKDGFSGVSVTKGSGDQGVDILATKGGVKYAIQCKNYASPLGNTPVQEVSAGKIFYNCHVGVVMTNSTFTPGAKTLAQATGVLLWDRTVLQSMIDKKE